MNSVSLEYAGSFCENFGANDFTEAIPNTGISVVPIFFSPIVRDLFLTYNNNLLQSWYEEFRREYIYGISIKLTSLSAFYELPSKQLAKSANIDIDDSDSVKTEKLLANYFQYQKIGLKLWQYQVPVWRRMVGYTENSIWVPKGETILQNKGIQVKLNLLPYLGSSYVGHEGGIGFQVIDKGNGGLRDGDYISISGEWECKITAMPKVTGVLNVVERYIPPEL